MTSTPTPEQTARAAELAEGEAYLDALDRSPRAFVRGPSNAVFIKDALGNWYDPLYRFLPVHLPSYALLREGWELLHPERLTEALADD